jgi:3-isopropylmalate/(R)-2-methylmalate dehydratase large subunit
MLVRFDGRFSPGVTAKDAILALIRKIGVDGGTGCIFEYAGEAIRSLDMEGRMTICNMSIEAGARAGLIAPDDVTIDYLRGRELSPRGKAWERAIGEWYALKSDDGAFDSAVTIDVSRLQPMITFGTSPEMAIGVNEPVPIPENEQVRAALDYMRIDAGRPLLGKPIDVVFIGSCTNGRISDLRSAAGIIAGRRVKVRALVVPGSQVVKRQAEAEGLDRIFLEAGAEWREPGCSMCIAMNGDQLEPGQCAVSTSNRNFEGRQGRGGRTILASPATAAAAAVTGMITDPRTLTRGDRWNRSFA